MLSSKLSKPCFYLESKADVTELMSMRHNLKKKFGIKITSNVFLIQTLAQAAAEYPLMLGTINGGSIRIGGEINVGFAVNAPQGLVVPVIRQADKKNLPQTAEIERLLTEKALSNKLSLDDIQDETIALSNLGAYGTDSFIGIVPPPASTILAAGSIIPAVIVRNGIPAVRKVMSLTIAVDHRIVNGVYAAQFLNSLREKLEQPGWMV